MNTSRVVLASFLALALTIGLSSNASSQTYKRHALIEEGTGTWCHACPPGAWTIDSLEKHYSETVAISWHGPYSNDVMGIKAGDTVAKYGAVSAYPWAIIGRIPLYPNGSYSGYPNPWTTTALSYASTASPVDFRIVNATYSSNSVDFDVDITPFDITKIPTEDTISYVTVAVLTEDGIVMSQQWDNPASGQQETDENFVHHNVARAVGGKVMGDPIVVQKATVWPTRRHYHIALPGSVDSPDSVRIKTFIAIKNKKSGNESYLEADQSGYVTSLPPSTANAVWIVMRSKSIVGDSLHIPIVWAKGGSVAAAKLDYSTDNGASWNPIVATTTQQPYEWTLPSDVYGQSVMIQVSDPANSSTKYETPAFNIGQKPVTSIAINSPATGDSLLAGSKTVIMFTPSGPVADNYTIEYSADGSTWNQVATGVTAHSYNWTVPSTPASSVMLRITSGDVTTTSGAFSILTMGQVTNVMVSGAPSIPLNTSADISWMVNGYLGESVDLDYIDGTTGLSHSISHNLPATITSYHWDANVMPQTPASGYQVSVKYASGASGESAPFAIGLASGVAENGEAAGITLSPNPTTSISSLRFSLSNPSDVTLIIRDLLGREVAHIAQGVLSNGAHEIAIDGAKVAAGTYEYVLVEGAKSYVGKLSIVR